MRTRIALLVAASLALAIPATTARATGTPVCDDAWHLETGPQDGQILEAVSSRWIQGAWAVGLVHDSAIGEDRTYLEHWSNDTWQHAPSPNMNDGSVPTDNSLYAVTGIGHDVWAAGEYSTVSTHSSDQYHPLAMHYDGHGWTIVPTDPQLNSGWFSGIQWISANDVWAAGGALKHGHEIPLIEHWDGVSWTRTSIPSPLDNTLNDVASGADGAVWAAGEGPQGVLVERWNGAKWEITPTPAVSGTKVAIDDIAAPSNTTGGAIAVGSYTPSSTPLRTETLTQGFDGSSWAQMDSPDPALLRNVFTAVDRGPWPLEQTWAVGYQLWGRLKPKRALIARLTDTGWVLDATPQAPGAVWLTDIAEFGVSTLDKLGGVAVGNGLDASNREYAVIMRRCSP